MRPGHAGRTAFHGSTFLPIRITRPPLDRLDHGRSCPGVAREHSVSCTRPSASRDRNRRCCSSMRTPASRRPSRARLFTILPIRRYRRPDWRFRRSRGRGFAIETGVTSIASDRDGLQRTQVLPANAALVVSADGRSLTRNVIRRAAPRDIMAHAPAELQRDLRPVRDQRRQAAQRSSLRHLRGR